MMQQIHGYCPMGCGETLFVDDDQITCLSSNCPRPDAVSIILSDNEIEHIVVIGQKDFTVKHPLRERLDNELLECDLFEHLESLDGPPVSPGQHYRVTRTGKVWRYDRITT
jgi:hypothetical protein